MDFEELLSHTSLLAQNYKCFGEAPAGFQTLRAMNLIIGRNNSGKSALLDLVELACNNPGVDVALFHKSKNTRILAGKLLAENELRGAFPDQTRGGLIPGNWWEYGKNFVDVRMTVELVRGNNVHFESLDTQLDYTKTRSLFEKVARSLQILFKNKIYQRLAADRDVVPEPDAGGEGIDKNGAGLTNTVQRYLTKAFLPTELVETRLLAALNKIFEPDAHFISIEVQQHSNGQWEIFMEEAGKGMVALSHSGSGLKTVLLVVAFLVLVPEIKKKPLSDFIFAFEELENNLHPALQRRLVQFIRELSLKDKCLTFLTSHSTVLIDMLSRDAAAQIVHVTHDGEVGVARPVKTYFENRGVLDDLDVRASDLLQSNGVVWVEGPSDRLYFNRWLALLTSGALKEGSHYQCVSYGGRLLAHLSGRDPWESLNVDEAMKILGINRNALILIDSDKKVRNAQLNATKRRIIEEFESFGGMVWVTKGRAIENYLPLSALNNILPEADVAPGDYDDFQEFWDRIKKGEGKKFARNKVLFAETIVPFISVENWSSVLDVRDKVMRASKEVAQWNAVSVTWA